MIFPTFFGNRHSPTHVVSTWLLSAMQENKTDNLGNVLSAFNKNIILRKDFVSLYPGYTPLVSIPFFREKWYAPLEPILDSTRDLKVISNISQHAVYENVNNVSKILFPLLMGED